MPTKNESLWLASGQAGENQARALNLPIEFTRVVVGDANDTYPDMDTSRTALINELLTGDILSHEVDPEDANQRIVTMSIPPSLDFDAVEMLLFAKYGNTEFAHTYFRLAAPYPIRTTENGGAQLKLKYTIRVNQNTDVNIFVSPNLAYTTDEQVNNKFKSVEVAGNMTAVINENRLHVFTTYADLQIPGTSGDQFRFVVDDSVDLSAGKCRVVAPIDPQTGEPSENMKISNNLGSHANITKNDVIYTAAKVNGVWKI